MPRRRYYSRKEGPLIPCEYFECDYEKVVPVDGANPSETLLEIKLHGSASRQWQPIFGTARCAWKITKHRHSHMGVLDCSRCWKYTPRC